MLTIEWFFYVDRFSKDAPEVFETIYEQISDSIYKELLNNRYF